MPSSTVTVKELRFLLHQSRPSHINPPGNTAGQACRVPAAAIVTPLLDGSIKNGFFRWNPDTVWVI